MAGSRTYKSVIRDVHSVDHLAHTNPDVNHLAHKHIRGPKSRIQAQGGRLPPMSKARELPKLTHQPRRCMTRGVNPLARAEPFNLRAARGAAFSQQPRCATSLGLMQHYNSGDTAQQTSPLHIDPMSWKIDPLTGDPILPEKWKTVKWLSKGSGS